MDVTPPPAGPVIALAGNPNVGKSTLFNALTGLRQHTGNWPGKTVDAAWGRCRLRGREFALVDLPGTYSLLARSSEEAVARDFLCLEDHDGAVVVCDATCLERSLGLALQILELENRTVVCVNLLDEAARRGLSIDLPALSERLGAPVVGTCAGRGEGLETLMEAAAALADRGWEEHAPVRYPPAVEFAAASLRTLVARRLEGRLSARWAALRLLEGGAALPAPLRAALSADPELTAALEDARSGLARAGLHPEALGETLATALVRTAEAHCRAVLRAPEEPPKGVGARLDRLFTRRATAVPAMLLLLAGVLWLTIQGANYPSQLLSAGLFWLGDRLSGLLAWLHAPGWLHSALVDGVYRVLAWVVSVMLPPMAIFFPLFTLLEDLGYLPRVAFVLDHAFQKAGACGKQALSMCMGLGCNAAGVVGCRIIDSPRERLIAVLTNSFVPCNGRFPTLITLIALLWGGTAAGGLPAALGLTGVLVLGILLTLAVSRLLSATLLKGVPSAFTLELPPYRRPWVGQVVVRSVLDRTLFVLGRAAAVAAPAGLVIWLCANLQVGGASLLDWCTGFLDPFARLLGLDGAILMAFLLGFPANEIVIPILLMAYLSTGTLLEPQGVAELGELLARQGWTGVTAVCTLLFTLVHWPCSTTCLTIARETRSVKWTLLALLLPTGVGMALCFCTASAARLLGLG